MYRNNGGVFQNIQRNVIFVGEFFDNSLFTLYPSVCYAKLSIPRESRGPFARLFANSDSRLFEDRAAFDLSLSLRLSSLSPNVTRRAECVAVESYRVNLVESRQT